jgi:hypothetical protein
MQVTDTGIPVGSLIAAVKAAVKAAGVSTTNTGRALRVASIQLILNAVVTATTGAKLEFKIPFVGMNVQLGTSITRHDTHTIDITLVPPDLAHAHEVRAADVDQVLVDAIETITAVTAQAADGDDPFLLKESSVELTFTVTDTGSISLGLNAEAKGEITHKLRLVLTAAPEHRS